MKLYNWPMFFGYALFIGMLAAGYYYNVTFIQLGVPDLGTRLIEMDEQELALYMAALALFASATAIQFGLLMRSRGCAAHYQASHSVLYRTYSNGAHRNRAFYP
ncbi:MAG TPA: hypothetical protein VE439_05765 [Anaerolineae bacterium]|nr:hypothetical protein [Anaerolineae bacterium]